MFVITFAIVQLDSGVMGHPATMCPRTNFLGPLVPQMNVSETQCPSIDTSMSFCTNLNVSYNA